MFFWPSWPCEHGIALVCETTEVSSNVQLPEAAHTLQNHVSHLTFQFLVLTLRLQVIPIRSLESVVRLNSIQNSLFSTQHVVNTTMFSRIRRVKKGASDSTYVGSFTILIIIFIKNLYTITDWSQFNLNNHNDNVLAMLLQSCKHKKTRNSCRIYSIQFNCFIPDSTV